MKKYQQKKNIEEQNIDDKIILFDINSFKFFELNETMSDIWSYIKKIRTKEDIVKEIVSKYEVTTKEGEKDVKEALQELKKENLIEEK